jgi:hypothetical protein
MPHDHTPLPARMTLGSARTDFMALTDLGPAAFLPIVKRHIVKLLLSAGLAYLVLAAIDYFWQVWRYEQSLRMSRDEIRQEMKQTDGDPLKKKVEAKGEFFTYEVYMNYSCVRLVADALDRAKAPDRAKLLAALESSTLTDHVMPYGPTKFVNGQNQGAAPANTQVLGNDIQVILPEAFASAKPVFPLPKA